MKESLSRAYRLANELTPLFELGSKIETMLSVSMYYLNQYMGSERSSIFLFQHWNQQLTIFSSLDLKKYEISIPTSSGIAGWVFVKRKPAIVNDCYQDSRFCKEVDEMTGFQTRNIVCAPLIDYKDNCLGTIQSLNKNTGDFTDDDLELLNLAAKMVTTAINNSRRYDELLVTNDARKNFIQKISNNFENILDQQRTDDESL
ncbi:hypothetical protein D3OALGB2SA_2982 [Olavius algarvensis associated proteobacterium Delta 3]|nr:hypothetical protein D3OALGB2SA_2982 [Olavius algarvensis associated proteobacterium Delta 3]